MINCLIVDDDNLMIHILESLLKEYNFLNIVSKVNSIKEAINVLKTEEIDLIFLDIEMPEISGIEFLKNYNETNAKIVIISSHEKYAIDAFEFNVMDYLLKPISRLRLLKTLNLLQTSFNKDNEKLFDSFYIKQNSEYISIKYNEIIYIESVGDYLKIILNNNKNYMIHSTLKKLIDKIPQDIFVRIHLSFIVNKNYVESFSECNVVVSGKTLPLGRKHRNAFLNNFNLY